MDRYGVPQYAGEPELYDEDEERAWDLWHGREGQDSMQAATAVHLRAGLSGTAYEAVRKLDHAKIKTKDSEGKPSQTGLKNFLKALKDFKASVKPVKANELFLQAFYSPNVWRRPQETMQQYIIRRKQDFRRLTEVSSETSVSQDLRAMMLLIFGGLDQKEQVSVLSSVYNTYDFDQIANAMRIQFPHASAHVSNAVSEYAKSFENVHMTEDEPAFAYDSNPVGPLDLKPNALQQVPEAPSGYLVNSVKEKTLEERNGNFGACFTFSLPSSTHEVLMVLKDTQLCAHRSYYGGNERGYHRGAHGHTRHIVRKDSECSKTEIFAERKDPGQLWRYLVQIALCTLWRRPARSGELFASVCRARDKAAR